MPKYFYIAKSLKGEEKSGTIEAKNLQQLSQSLKEQGFILIKAESKSDKEKKPPTKFCWGVGGVSLTEKLMFTRNLQVMITSGLPLPRSLETLALQSNNKKFRKALLEIREKIIKGSNFSEDRKSVV